MAVFDADEAFLRGFLSALPQHLTQTGRGLLILSDLAELLGLRQPGALVQLIESSGLTIARTHTTKAKHGKAKDREDPLHAARSKETTTLYELVRR